ncbi:hypothetical protein [Macrococcus equi]|uniref:hypothetical protein n=1 Tax=Macrococcus equi TaxID=3395462 RepID=UPI0039BECF4A
MRKIRGKKRIYNKIKQLEVDQYQLDTLGINNIYIPQFFYVDEMCKNDKLFYGIYKSMILKANKSFKQFRIIIYINETYPMNSQLIIQESDYWNQYEIDTVNKKSTLINNLERKLKINFEKIKDEKELIWIAKI